MAHLIPSLLIQEDCLVTALKYMTAFSAKAIEAIGKRTLEPAHPFHQVSTWSF